MPKFKVEGGAISGGSQLIRFPDVRTFTLGVWRVLSDTPKYLSYRVLREDGVFIFKVRSHKMYYIIASLTEEERHAMLNVIIASLTEEKRRTMTNVIIETSFGRPAHLDIYVPDQERVALGLVCTASTMAGSDRMFEVFVTFLDDLKSEEAQ